MIYDFAIEPEAVVNLTRDQKDYSAIIRAFGLGEPRVMAEYPNLQKWKQLVKRLISPESNLDDMHKKRAGELMSALATTVARRNSPYDDSLCWLENAEQEHSIRNFYLILATQNPRNHEAILLGSDCLGCVACASRCKNHPVICTNCRWDMLRGVILNRTVVAFGQTIGYMLSICSEARFVDPYFAPAELRYQSSFREYFRHFFKCVLPIGVKIYTSNKIDRNLLKDQCEKHIAPLIPQGSIVYVIQRQNGHNRYILTDLGGVSFGHGLDTGKDNQTDDVMLLVREQYEQYWHEYELAEHEDMIITEGTKNCQAASETNPASTDEPA